jgi:hypothetical protein
MATKQLHPPSELPMVRAARSDRRSLREWRDFLAPKELEGQRVVREIIASTTREIPRTSPKRVQAWDQDRLIDFALNAPYPDDIEEQIEKSWQR